MRLETFQKNQILIGLITAVVTLSMITIWESYMLTSLTNESDKIIADYEPMYFKILQNDNCADLNDLSVYLQANLVHHGASAKAWNESIIKYVKDRCG